MLLPLTALILSILSIFLVYKSKSLDRYYTVKKDKKFTISPIFWEDYNRINMAIYLMDNINSKKVWYQIDSFTDKYSQYVDYKAYNDCIETLISNYNRRKQFL